MIFESAHPYVENFDYTWTYTLPGSPATISVTFDALTEVEANYDFIYVMDGSGTNIAGSPFTGVSLAGQTVVVPGDTVQIRLTSDSSVCYWGFGVTDVVEGGTPAVTFTITPISDPDYHGYIYPDTPESILQGFDSDTFYINAAWGYALTDVLVDDVSVGAVSEYQFTDVQSDHTIQGVFTALPSFTIHASVNNAAYGSLSPSGDFSTPQGESCYVNIYPNTGYQISDVLVDGVSVGAVSWYEFDNVQEDHTIEGIFSALPPVHFVAVAALSAIAASSPDGIAWTQRVLPTNSNWRSVTYGNGMFVAVGYMSGAAAAASSPDGIAWTARTMPSGADWYSVTYGNGMFVAIGYGGGGAVVAASSPDGISWTARAMPSSGYWQSVAYGNGMFVAIMVMDSAAASSPDGITWTARTLPASASWQSVTFGNGMFVTIDFYGAVAISSDGITWTLQTLPSSGNWQAITYGHGLFVALGYFGVAASSPDGITWTARTLPASAYWYSVAYGGELFVAAVVYDTITIGASSPDGISWTERTMPSAFWTSVAYGAGNVPPAISVVHSFPWVGHFQMCKVKEVA